MEAAIEQEVQKAAYYETYFERDNEHYRASQLNEIYKIHFRGNKPTDKSYMNGLYSPFAAGSYFDLIMSNTEIEYGTTPENELIFKSASGHEYLISQEKIERASVLKYEVKKFLAQNNIKILSKRDEFYGEILGVRCKTQTDFIVEYAGQRCNFDLKTTTTFVDAKKAANFGYDLQAVFNNHLAKCEKTFLLIANMKDLSVSLFEITPELLEFGQKKLEFSINFIKNEKTKKI